MDLDLTKLYYSAKEVLSEEEKLELNMLIGMYQDNEDYMSFNMRPIVFVAFKLYLVKENIETYACYN